MPPIPATPGSAGQIQWTTPSPRLLARRTAATSCCSHLAERATTCTPTSKRAAGILLARLRSSPNERAAARRDPRRPPAGLSTAGQHHRAAGAGLVDGL